MRIIHPERLESKDKEEGNYLMTTLNDCFDGVYALKSYEKKS